MTFYMGSGAYGYMSIAEIVAILLWLAFVVCLIVAYFMSIKCLVDAAWAKTERLGRGKLWFIGLFTTPIVLGLITCALKDEKGAKAAAQAVQATSVAQPAAQIPAPQVTSQAAASAQAPAEGSAPAGE